MLHLLIYSFLLVSYPLLAQADPITIELEGATELHLSALFSNVELRTAEDNALTIEHTVVVEDVARPELGELDIKRDGKRLEVTEVGPSMEQLKRNWKEKGQRSNCCNSQIELVVRVPAGVTVTVETVYGSVDVTDLVALRAVRATYGGVTVVYAEADLPQDLELYSNYGAVDLSIPEGQGARVALTTQHGELLTDLDLTIDEAASEKRDFYEHVVGTVDGGGANVRCEAPYGKVYLRRGVGR